MKVPVSISTSTTLFQKVYIDVMFIPLSGGYHLIVAAKDNLSEITEARALTNATSENLAKFFKEAIYY